MGGRAICVALLLASLPLAGCGTVTNLASKNPGDGGKTPFGGVRQDVYHIKEAANAGSGSAAHADAGSEQHPKLACLLYGADLPLTLLGDFLTWPYTAAYTFINQPVPVPPVIFAPNAPPPQLRLEPAGKEADKMDSDKKDADKKDADKKDADKGTPDKPGQGKPMDDGPGAGPSPLPQPRKLTP